MVSEDTVPATPPVASNGGGVTRVLATIGAVALFLVVGASVFQFVSGPAQDCLAQGQSRVVCAAGSLGLVDLAALSEKDRRIEALAAEVTAKTAAAADAEKRAGDLDTRVKDLEGALAGAKAATAEADRLRGEIARRDARIAEREKAAAAKRPEPIPVPTARPAAPAAQPAARPPTAAAPATSAQPPAAGAPVMLRPPKP